MYWSNTTKIYYVYYCIRETSHYHHHHHHHYIYVMQLGHLLTRSCITYPEVSSKVCHNSCCQKGSSVSLSWVIYFEALYVHRVSIFSCIPVICPKLVLFLASLQFVHLFCNLSQVYVALLLMYFVSAAVILLASLALVVLSCCSSHVFHLCCCYSSGVPWFSSSILLFFSCISSLLLLFFWRPLV